MVIALYFLYIIISTYLAFFKPTKFVIYYIIVFSKFLGFFSPEQVFIIGGLSLGFFGLNIVTLLAVIFSNRIKKQKKISKKFFYPFLIFLFFGICYPVIEGSSSFLIAIITSKNLWSVIFLFYLVRHSSFIDLHQIIKVIQNLGIYLSLIYLVNLFLRISPPFYLESKLGVVGNYVRVYYPTYISLAIFITSYFKTIKKPSFFNYNFIIFLLFIGVFLSGHFSLFVGTLIGYILFNIFKDFKKKKSSIAFKFSIFLIISILIGFLFSNKIEILNNKLKINNEKALTSRDRYNEFRWDAIDKQPLFGYGFLKRTKEIFMPTSESGYMQSLGVIDSGYVDLLIKFGYIGSFFYLLVWLRIIILPLKRISKTNFLDLAMTFYLLQYFVINYTWSVFSYNHGLVPGFLAIFIILVIKSDNNDNVATKKMI